MTQQINLFNPALREKRSPLSFDRAILGWGAVALLTAAWAAYAEFGAHSLATQETAVSNKLAVARDDLEKLTARASTRKHDPQILAELERLEAQVRDRHEVMDFLKSGELGDTGGFSEHFRAFARQSFDGVWLTGLHIAASGQDMTVEGKATKAEHVPGYLKRLNGERVMQGHPFSELLIQMPKAEAGEQPVSTPDFVEFRLATRSGEKSANRGSQQ